MGGVSAPPGGIGGMGAPMGGGMASIVPPMPSMDGGFGDSTVHGTSANPSEFPMKRKRKMKMTRKKMMMHEC